MPAEGSHISDKGDRVNVKKNVKQLLETGFVHIFSSQVLNKVISSCSGLVVVNFLSKNDYGIYSYAINILSTFLLVSGLGLNSAILQMGSEEMHSPQRQEAFARYGYRLGMRWNVLLCLGIVLFCAFFSFPIAGSRTVLLWMAGMPLLYFTMEVLQSYFRIRLMNKAFSYLSTGIALAGAIFLIIGAYFNSLKLIVVLRYVAYFGVTFLFARRVNPQFLRFSSPEEQENTTLLTKKDKKELLSVGLVSLFNNSISSLLFLIDGWLIGSILSSAVVMAEYHTASLIPMAMLFVPAAVVTYVYPYIASHHEDQEWLRTNLKRLYWIMGAINAVISILLFVSAPLIFRLLFPQYMHAVPIFRVLAVGYFFAGTFRTLSGNVLVMLHRLRVNSVVAIISGVMNVILDAWWISQFGAIGAAYATTAIFILSGLLSTGYIVYYMRHHEWASAV